MFTFWGEGAAGKDDGKCLTAWQEMAEGKEAREGAMSNVMCEALWSEV